jgi:CheY-like chemotaxis protein
VDPQAPATVTGDPTRLRQILLNLTSNAIKFTFEGHILIEVALVEHEAGRCRLRFSVSDTGIGIPVEKQAMIFDRFSQADTSTTRRFGGTGLGLAISQELAGLMGGHIAVTSSPTQGTRFEFELSLPASSSSPAAQPLKSTRVLVLDRSALTRSILSELISAWGASVTAVANLREAGPIEQYQVAIAALGTLMNAPTVPSMPIPVLVLYGNSDRMSRGESWPDAWSAAVKSLRVPVGSAELLGTLLALLEKPAPDARQGCVVDIARDGAQAVEMWSHRTHDAVLMDCQMPEKDGFEATAAIRRAERGIGTHIPIIAMTANAMTGDRERCLRAGMDSYLSKPVTAEQISRALHEFTGGTRTEDRARSEITK